ncbi:MAG: choice-of-anchor Q domain-containing protein [Bacteroidota bacterium]
MKKRKINIYSIKEKLILLYTSMHYALYLISLFICIICVSCRKNQITTDHSARIEFSTNVILFDTVFSTVGSTTKSFLVFNHNSSSINISSIKLARGNSSNFRINVDGMKGISFNDVEIKGKDSIFIFVEVTVDPNNQNNPLIIRDSIVFETNENIQDVNLEAWGQDAYFYTPNIFPTNGFPPYSVISRNTIWTNDKPHVIYNYLVVDSGSTLTIQQGAKIYLHPGGVLWIYKDGTLIVNGNRLLPVTFQGDRLEPEYSELPGQWGTIWISRGSKNNIIDWAIIKNGFIGLQIDTLGNSPNPTLTISNTIIKNMSAAALFAQGSFVKGWNCMFSNCGQYVVALTIGGRYNFYHCTFANYWRGNVRQFPVLVLNNYYKDKNNNIQTRNLDSAYFYNCIVYGDLNSGDEMKLDKSANTSFAFNYKFNNCLLRTTLETTSNEYNHSIKNAEPYFYNINNQDYRIRNPLSSVIDKGDNTIGMLFPDDMMGKSRIVNRPPDIGAYEYEP